MKRIFAFLLCAVMVFALSLTVHAHPGRTDANGGHTDRSTGEYHYHHGYPEHDHTDMDGDGVADCPYEFDDKTNSENAYIATRSTEATSSPRYMVAISSTRAAPASTPATTPVSSGSNLDQESSGLMNYEVNMSLKWLICIVGVLGIVIASLIIALRNQKNIHSDNLERVRREIGYQKDSYEKAIAENNKEHSEEVSTLTRNIRILESDVSDLRKICDNYQKKVKSNESECRKYRTLSSQKDIALQLISACLSDDELRNDYDCKQAVLNFISHLDEIPDDVRFVKSFRFSHGIGPISGEINPDKFYGNFTVYVSEYGKVYHSNPKCCRNLSPAHIYDVIGVKRPCRNCSPVCPDSVPDWYTALMKLLSYKSYK